MRKIRAALLPLLLFTVQALGQGALQKGNDGKPIEAGLRFSTTDSVSGAQFFKPPVNAWTIRLYDSTGQVLDTAVSLPTAAGWGGVRFSKVYPPGKYTVSYYSASGDYTYTPNYFQADSAWIGLATPKNAGVYTYGSGYPTSAYLGTSYEIWPVINPSPVIITPDTSKVVAVVVVVGPDGSPVRLPDGTTAVKMLLGYDPPGKLLEQFQRYVSGVMYLYTIYEHGATRRKRVNGAWVAAPY
jgi:hypothetical protein